MRTSKMFCTMIFRDVDLPWARKFVPRTYSMKSLFWHCAHMQMYLKNTCKTNEVLTTHQISAQFVQPFPIWKRGTSAQWKQVANDTPNFSTISSVVSEPLKRGHICMFVQSILKVSLGQARPTPGRTCRFESLRLGMGHRDPGGGGGSYGEEWLLDGPAQQLRIGATGRRGGGDAIHPT